MHSKNLENNEFYVNTIKSDLHSTKIEIKVIEPIYEYQVIFKYDSFFGISSGHYLNESEFYMENTYLSTCFVELYEPSKRERVS